jgi:hypothetical protein
MIGGGNMISKSQLKREGHQQINLHDFVRLLDYPEDSPNSSAMVVNLAPGGVVVSNGNMPFTGSLCNDFFPFTKVRKIPTR